MGTNHVAVSQYNPKGYCELLEVLELHNRCLGSLQTTWDSLNFLPSDWQKSEAAQLAKLQIRDVFTKEFAGRDLWGVKDARLCRLAPLWQEELQGEGLKVIVPLRHPFEVAHSLARFAGKKWTASLVYWLFNLFESERSTRSMTRVLTTYTELLTDPVKLMNRIEHQLDITFPCPAEERHSKLSNWVNPDLCRFRQQQASPSEPGLEQLKELVDSVYRQFLNKDVFTNHERADALFEQCFGAAYFSYATTLHDKWSVHDYKERDRLRMRLESAEAWMKGPWIQRAFHRWNDPANPRAKIGFFSRVTNSIRKRIQPAQPARARLPWT